MPNAISTPVKNLTLDLSNYRTVKQSDEITAVQAMISISSDRFWALMESMIDSGYLPTENIIVLRRTKKELVVKDGNRRIAVLKLLLKEINRDAIDIPANVVTKLNALPQDWEKNNLEVPCAIYELGDAVVVDKIVSLAHGKGEKAGKDQWNAVARARHNRDVGNSSEPALDLLEKYLKNGRNLTELLAERWAGDYPLSVLEEAMKRTSTRFGVSSAPDLAKGFPSIQYRDALERILFDIGMENLDFKKIRDKNDFAIAYGLPPLAQAGGSATSQSGKTTSSSSTTQGQGVGAAQPTSQGGAQSTSQNSQAGGATQKKTVATAMSDPKTVQRTLRRFRPLGNNREKLVDLKNEALRIDIVNTPLAFCFLLRSMFEISAKAYCDDYKAASGPSATRVDGTDRFLVDVLRDVTNHLISRQGQNQAASRALKGAMTELGKTDSILSVHSMNQLIHNPSFSITASDISIMFGNIFPLLNAMNQ